MKKIILTWVVCFLMGCGDTTQTSVVNRPQVPGPLAPLPSGIQPASSPTPHPSSDPRPPPPTNLLDGPAESLLIDGTVHTGVDPGNPNGPPTTGVWGAPFDFHMAHYPLSWAIAVVHSSLLHRMRDINYSPNAILSVAIKESHLKCLEPDFPNNDGCFQIESTSAYAELQKIFPERFTKTHEEVISKDHFESSALTMVYYNLFSMGMFYLRSQDPYAFFKNHPDAQAQQKVISGAYNRGLWWEGLKNVFTNCGQKNVTECFLENNPPTRQLTAIDHAEAIADYTKGLNQVTPFEVELTLDDLKNYWLRIKPLYPDVSDILANKTLQDSFDKIRDSRPTISFHSHLKEVLTDLIAVLPPLPTNDDVIKTLCKTTVGYLYTFPPCPASN